MEITIGTFNLNNLFSRYNFEAEIPAIRKPKPEAKGEIIYSFSEESGFRIRTYKGKLVRAKKPWPPRVILFDPLADRRLGLCEAMKAALRDTLLF